MAEYNGNLLDSFNKSASDWILIDLRSILKGNYLVTIGEKQYCYSFHFDYLDSALREGIIKYWKKNGVTVDNASIKKVDFIDVPDCDKIFDDFCSFLKNKHGKKIILLLLKQADYKINEIGEVAYIGSEKRDVGHLILDEYTCRFMEKTDCHCIHVPANIVSDNHNIWGPGDVHYVREFYDYALECLDIITGSQRNKLHHLDRIYAKYVMLFDQIRYGFSFTEYSAIYTFEKKLQDCKSKENFDAIKSDYEQLLDSKCNSRIIGEIEGRFGLAYRDGKGVGKDLNEAAKWMRGAASRNIKSAKWTNELFDVLWRIGTPESMREMIESVTKFASTGDAGAMGRLGRAYRDGKGVGKDLGKAAEWIRKAAGKSANWEKELSDLLAQPR